MTGIQATGSKASDQERKAIRQIALDFCRSATDGRQIFDAMATSVGYDRRVWDRMSQDLGLIGLLVPEGLGGLGLGFAEAALVLAEAGRALLPSPLLPTLAMTQVLARLGSTAASELLATLAAGRSATLALNESPFALISTEFSTRVVDSQDQPRLYGIKNYVINGDSADVLIVAAGAGADVGLYAVEGSAPGVVRTCHATLDQTRRLATVEFAGVSAVRLMPDAAVGGGPVGAEAVRYAESIMLVSLAVEAAACAQECLDRTVAYLKVREQFGRVLGSFQALRHRCAWMAVRVQGALATAQAAVAAIDGPEHELAAALARAVCGDVFMFVAGEMIQLHGGIGFTFEHPAHLYFKRAESTNLLFGSSDELRDRVGSLIGL